MRCFTHWRWIVHVNDTKWSKRDAAHDGSAPWRRLIKDCVMTWWSNVPLHSLSFTKPLMAWGNPEHTSTHKPCTSYWPALCSTFRLRLVKAACIIQLIVIRCRDRKTQPRTMREDRKGETLPFLIFCTLILKPCWYHQTRNEQRLNWITCGWVDNTKVKEWVQGIKIEERIKERRGMAG